jgi:serine/threonine protein kinase
VRLRPAELIGKRVANRYDVAELLGSGGMADVFRAVDRLLQRDVALKVLTEQSEPIRHRFLLEARSLARLNHPGIVAIYDAGESSGIPYIVMELALGPTLGDLMATGTTIGFAVRAAIGVLDALEYAHEHDVLHRDVKPSNIVVRSDGEVKIMDFGLSRRISDLSAGTQAGEIVGTVSYLSPERFLGKSSDARGDLYSLGIILYELFTGALPFKSDRDDLVALVFAHVNETAVPPSRLNPSVGPELERIVLKLIEKEPDSRYQTARALQDDLRAYLLSSPDADTARIEPHRSGS